MSDPKSVLEFAKKNGAKLLDLRFTDLPGLWHHVSYPIDQFDESSFEDGFGMDGSSIRGWAAIHESDMLLIPDPSWMMMDPFAEVSNLGDDRRCSGSGNEATLRPRSALHREESRDVPGLYRTRRHGVFRRRGGVFHLR